METFARQGEGFHQIVSADELELLDCFRACERALRDAILFHAQRCAGRRKPPHTPTRNAVQEFLAASDANAQRIFDEANARAARRAARAFKAGGRNG